MKYVVVLGSSGFIGGHLVKHLMDLGHYVIGVDIRDVTYDCFKPTEFIRGDLRDIQFVKLIFGKVGNIYGVYQLAADVGGSSYINGGSFDGSIMSNSAMINLNVANCCVEFKVGRLFFASSTCVYSSKNDVVMCKEDDVYPALPENEYGWEKLFSERVYTNFYQQYGLEVRIARFHNIVGDYSVWFNEKAKAHGALAYKVAMVENGGVIDVIGDGIQARTFLYVKDCVEGICKLMDSDCREIVNIGSDVHITINEYIESLRKVSGKQFSVRYIDGATGVKNRFCDLTKVKKLLDWKPVMLNDDIVKITYEWTVRQIGN